MAMEVTPLNADVFAQNTSRFIKEKNVMELINIVKQINLYDEKSSITVQKLTEHCLKDIIVTLTEDQNDPAMSFLLWSLLSAISSLTVARKILWKDPNIVKSLRTSLGDAIETSNRKLQKVTTSLLSSMLIGANQTCFDTIAELGFIELLKSIISGDFFHEELFKSVICCLSLLCDGSLLCKQRLNDLKVADAMFKMGEKHPLIDEDLCNLAALTYDDLSALKMGSSIGRTKFLKSKCTDQVVCSNPKCLKPQEDVKFKKCSRCKMTLYCSKECQIEHWKRGGHHQQCVPKKNK